MDVSWIRGIFTPSVLFLLLNLVIAIIAVISSRHRTRRSAGSGDHQNLPLARSSSSNVLERVRSLGLFRFRSSDFPPITDADASDAPQEEQDHPQPTEHQRHQFRRIHSESDSKPKDRAPEEAAAATMEKSTSTITATWRSEEVEVGIARRPAARREAVLQDEEVDAKADDFINRFRHQLRLQRLDSLLRYRSFRSRGAGGQA